MNVESFLLPGFSSHILQVPEEFLLSAEPFDPRQGEVIYFLLPGPSNDGEPANNEGGQSSHQQDRGMIRPVQPPLLSWWRS